MKIWSLYRVTHCRGFLQTSCHHLPSGSNPPSPPPRAVTTHSQAQSPKTHHCQSGADEPLQITDKWPAIWRRRVLESHIHLSEVTLNIVEWRQCCSESSPRVSLSSGTGGCSHLRLSCRRKTFEPDEHESAVLTLDTSNLTKKQSWLKIYWRAFKHKTKAEDSAKKTWWTSI